jgi:hypothetical protein
VPLSGSTMYHAPPFRAGSHHRVLTGTGLRGLNRSLFETQACLRGPVEAILYYESAIESVFYSGRYSVQ